MIKCLIFDNDGTLVDSELLCSLGLEIQLSDYGIKVSAQDLMKKFIGGKLADSLRAIEQEHGVILKDDFVENYRHKVDQLFERELKACKGVVDFLNHNSLAVCVASNGPTNKINKALEITSLKKYFNDNIFSAYEIESWKPSPKLFLHAAKAMGFFPHECLVIEDSEKGIKAGLAAEMKTVLFDSMNVHPNIIGIDRIDDMTKLSNIISTINKTKI
jgi:HAD superfamily hydrolase (TIGR01509 family)